MSFSILQPPRILFGRGMADQAPPVVLGFGRRVMLVQGRNAARSAWLAKALTDAGASVMRHPCPGEPTLAMLDEAVQAARAFGPQVIVGLGGGAVIDLAKAVAALVPAGTPTLDHLEGVGKALPLPAPPLPFVAIPTTSGTGAEVTKNAVIGVPEQGRKVSLRDDRMIARMAIVDPALTDGCPAHVTLASGLDAVTQVIEPYLSCRANAYSDAIARPAIGPGLAALARLTEAEDAAARDAIAWTSLSGGLALANSGLGAVHGFAAVIGGMTGAAHGAICGALLGPVLAMNHRRGNEATKARAEEIMALIAGVLGGPPSLATERLADWAHGAGLPRLSEMGVQADQHGEIARAAQGASSMKGNPVALSEGELIEVLQKAG